MSWLLILSLIAQADVAPPIGSKLAKYEIVVEGAPADGPAALAVYPWSLSNGAPTAEAALVPAVGSLAFGRRIMGEPAFWLVPSSEVAVLTAAGDDELRQWFEGGSAVRCTGDVPQPRFEVSVAGPDVLVDRFSVEVSQASCVVRQLAPASAPALALADGRSLCGCSGVGSSAVWFAPLLALAALLRRRR